MELKDLVKDKTVSFLHYHDGNLWYQVDGTDPIFTFPVPTDDIGNAIFKASDKSMLFMRYIRKHLATIQEAKNVE